MCLAVPAKIIELNGDDATVELDGMRRVANVTFIDAPAVGDYVLLHAGFAIRKWSQQAFDEYQEALHETIDAMGTAPEQTTEAGDQ